MLIGLVRQDYIPLYLAHYWCTRYKNLVRQVTSKNLTEKDYIFILKKLISSFRFININFFSVLSCRYVNNLLFVSEFCF